MTASPESAMPLPYGVAGGVNAEVGCSVASIYAKMRALEDVGRSFDTTSKYLKHRRVLVDWICEVGEEHGLHSSTMHVAVSHPLLGKG